MMATAYTRGGGEWTPHYLESVDVERCIGCGRCFKACGRGVMAPVDKPFADEEDEFGDDMGNVVMSVAQPDACVGCQACARACTREAHAFVTT